MGGGLHRVFQASQQRRKAPEALKALLGNLWELRGPDGTRSMMTRVAHLGTTIPWKRIAIVIVPRHEPTDQMPLVRQGLPCVLGLCYRWPRWRRRLASNSLRLASELQNRNPQKRRSSCTGRPRHRSRKWSPSAGLGHAPDQYPPCTSAHPRNTTWVASEPKRPKRWRGSQQRPEFCAYR
jgi:hypothetical protein